MNKKQKKQLWIIGAIILAILLYNYSELGTIFMQTEQIQYNNKPILVRFTTSNFTNPSVQTFFNNQELFTSMNNNGTLNYTKTYINGTYTIRVDGIISTGVLTITLKEGNITESQSTEIKNPYVAVEHSIPTNVEVNSQTPLKITTLNPQGELLEADEVAVDIYDPTNQKTTIIFDKAGNVFTKTFYYSQAGNYQFKIHARKAGFETREKTVITAVTKTQHIHPIIWVWTSFIVIFLILALIKYIRRKRIW